MAQFAEKAAAASTYNRESFRDEFSIDVNVDNIEALLNQQRTSYDLGSLLVQNGTAADNV